MPVPPPVPPSTVSRDAAQRASDLRDTVARLLEESRFRASLTLDLLDRRHRTP